jgi:hypothetical protein
LNPFLDGTGFREHVPSISHMLLGMDENRLDPFLMGGRLNNQISRARPWQGFGHLFLEHLEIGNE